MTINKAYLLYKKEVRLGLKDYRSLFIIILSTLIFYPGLIIGMTYLQIQDSKKAELSTPKMVIQGSAVHEFDINYGFSPFHIVKSSNPQTDLIENKVEGILTVEKNSTNYHIHYEYKKKNSKSLYSSEKVSQWIASLQKEEQQKYLSSLGVETDRLSTITIDYQDLTPNNQKNMISDIIPYFVWIGIIAGSMGIGIENTAGEKEKKTFVTLISSNITRKQIALGKIGSTSFFGFISAILTIIGLLSGAFFSSKMLEDTKMITLSLNKIVILFLVLVFSAVLISSLMVILGVIAKTMKEANSYIMPLYLAVIFAGILSNYLNQSNYIWSLVPIINSSLIIKSLFEDKVNLRFILLSLVTATVFIAVLVQFSIRLFESEEKTIL